MDKIPTAEEFLKQKPFIHSMTRGDQQVAMIEFAKLHLQAQKEAIVKNAKVLMIDNCSDHTPYWGACSTCGEYHNYKIPSEEIDKSSVLNSYPLDNIK